MALTRRPSARLEDRDIERSLRVVAAVIVVNVALAVAVSLHEWSDVVRSGSPESDEWLSLLLLVYVPVVVAAGLLVRRALTRLRERSTTSEQRLDQVLDATTEWVWTIDSEGRFVSSNRAVEHILGWRPDELIGRSAYDTVHVDDRGEIEQAVNRAASAREGWSKLVMPSVHRDGSIRYLLSTATPILDAAGEPSGFIGADRDVTNEVLAARAAEQEAAEAADRRAQVQELLEARALEMVFQPIMNLETGEADGVEALARFPTTSHGPAHWFSEAALVGLGTEFELLAVDIALGELPKLDAPAYMSINVSPQTLTDPAFTMRLLAPGVPCHRLVVELTEHIYVTDYHALEEAIDRLRRLGVRLAVDDAGAGYASLRHILQLRPDVIKLDGALTSAITNDPVRRSLTSAMVLFALEVDATLVVERVEDHDSLDTLRRLGVTHIQGYILGRPQPLPLQLQRRPSASRQTTGGPR